MGTSAVTAAAGTGRKEETEPRRRTRRARHRHTLLNVLGTLDGSLAWPVAVQSDLNQHLSATPSFINYPG